MTNGAAGQHDGGDLRQRLAALRDSTAVRATTAGAGLAEKLARRAELLRDRLQDGAHLQPRRTVLTFTTAGQRYAVAVERVLEVQPLEHFSPVPGAPAFVRGVAQCRGSILCLLDLGRFFNVPETGLADVHHMVVVEGLSRRIALAAGLAEEILAIPANDIKPAPAFASQLMADCVEGVFDDNRLLLDVDALLQDHRLVDGRRG